MHSESLEHIQEAELLRTEEERIRLTLSTGILSQVLKNVLRHSKRVMTNY